MSIELPLSNELFTVRIEYFHKLSPEKKYNCTHQGLNVGTAVMGDLDAFATALCYFMQDLTVDDIVISRAVISTFVPDSSPYEGNEFRTLDVNLVGSSGTASTQLLPMKIALFIRKKVVTGRSGKTFLRGALAEDMVQFGQSTFAPTDYQGLNNKINLAYSNSGLINHGASGESPVKWVILKRNGNQAFARYITGVEFGGIQSIAINHRYFDK